MGGLFVTRKALEISDTSMLIRLIGFGLHRVFEQTAPQD